MSALLERERPTAAAPKGEVGLPAWPLLAMVWGFPVFWALGMTVIAAGGLAMVMLCLLIHGRQVLVVPGVLAVVGFLAWVVPTVVMIDSTERLLGFAYRFVILAVVVTAFVYAISARSSISRMSVIRALTFLWFVTIIGGTLGMLFPEVRLSTPVGVLLPESLTSNPYVHDLFFPPLAEVQNPPGSPAPFVRPSAPFPYANSWGVAIVLLTPVAAARFVATGSWWLRVTIIGGAAVMVVPAMASSNRGMFAGLVVAAVYVVARLAARDRAAPVLTISVLGLVGAVALIGNGLLGQIATRQKFGGSNDVRLDLYGETITRTMQSPLLGYGAPRPSLVHDYSVGTQGYIWMLMFSFGFVGLGLFLWFLWGTTLRTWRAPGDVNLLLHSVLVVASVLIVVYGLDIMQLLAVMLVAAVLLRERYLPTADVDGA